MNNDNNTNFNPTGFPGAPVQPDSVPQQPVQPQPMAPQQPGLTTVNPDAIQPMASQPTPVVQQPQPMPQQPVQPQMYQQPAPQPVQPTPAPQPQHVNPTGFTNPLAYSSQPAPQPPKKNNKLPLIIGIAVGAVVVIGIIIAVVSGLGGSNKMVCTYTETLDGGIKDYEEHKIVFNKDNYAIQYEKKVVLTFDTLTDEKYKAIIDKVGGNNCTFSDKCSETNYNIDAGLSSMGLDTKIVRSGNTITITSIERAGLQQKATKDDIQKIKDKYVKNSGWTCK